MKKSHLILPVIILIFVAVFAMISISDISDNPSEPVQQQSISPSESSAEEQTEIIPDTTELDQNLSNTAKSSQDEQDSSSTASLVTPIITSWGAHSTNESYTVSSFVQGTIENGGSCKLSMKKDSDVYSAEKTAKAGAQNTTCGTFEIPATELSSGVWTVTIEYVSANYQGSSDTVELEVL